MTKLDSEIAEQHGILLSSLSEGQRALVVEALDEISELYESRIKALEGIAYSVQSADLCYGSYTMYEIYEDTVYKAKEILGEQDND